MLTLIKLKTYPHPTQIRVEGNLQFASDCSVTGIGNRKSRDKR